MLDYRLKIRLIGLSILIEVLIFSVEICGQLQNIENKQSLINKSMVATENSKEFLNQDNDMWSMMVPLNGNIDVSSAEYKYEDSSTKRLKLDWHLKLDQDDRYRLDWTVDYAANQIIFALNINTTTSSFRQGIDIFALGFSNYGQLNSSDFCIIWYDLGHRIHLQDARTNSNNRLELVDESQSFCKLLKSSLNQLEDERIKSSYLDNMREEEIQEFKSVEKHERSEKSGYIDVNKNPDSIEIIFKRPLEICTSKPYSLYYTIDNGTSHLVWFTIKGPLLSIDGLNLTKLMDANSSIVSIKHHSERQQRNDNGFEYGMKRVQLVANKPMMSETLAKNPSIDIKMDKFQIPAKETTYWCKLFKLPHKFEFRKYHVTRYEAVVEKKNDHIVHHMELFNCANLDADQERDLDSVYENGGWAGNCGDLNRPKATMPCRRVILAWAMGAHPLEYPKQVGQSIGGKGYSPYVVLEVHYNNVESTAGLIDNSGLKFHYTSKLRPYDAGILEVGLEYTDKNSIPANLITPIAGHCVSECTRVALSSSATGKLDGQRLAQAEHLERGIYIFAAQMHTHLTGVSSWTEHIREGQLLDELQRDNHYSPHFQEIRLLQKEIHVAPGDALVHYCLYDTRDRVNITLGGYAISDEMCVTYLHYYPRLDLEVCKSSVDTNALEAYFAYLAKEEGQQTSERLLELHPDDVKAKSVSENYRSIEWSKKRSQELVQFYSNAPLSVQCNRSNGDRYPGYWNGVTPTRLWADLKAQEPYNSKFPNGQQLVEYRGRGYKKSHAQCSVNRSKGSFQDPDK